MSDTTVAIVTKTYAPDLERCELLCRTVDSLVSASTHWVVVDRKDRSAFAHLAGPKRQVVTTEELLPVRTLRITLGRLSRRRNLWVTTGSRPMRGWLVQQLAKLAVANVTTEDVLFFVDSDIAFVRKFDTLEYTRGAVPLFRVLHAIDEHLPVHVKWHRTSETLLELPATSLPAPDYVGPLIFWRRENVLALLERIESNERMSWLRALARASDVSEYTLYGRFATEVLADSSGHELSELALCHSYWGTEPLDEDGVNTFLDGLADHHVAVMLNPKAGMSAKWYETLLDRGRNDVA